MGAFGSIVLWVLAVIVVVKAISNGMPALSSGAFPHVSSGDLSEAGGREESMHACMCMVSLHIAACNMHPPRQAHGMLLLTGVLTLPAALPMPF